MQQAIYVLLISSLFAGAALSFEYKGTTHPDIEALFEEVKSNPDANIREESGVWRISVNAEAGYVTYFFTQGGHAAHPAVVIRSVYEDEGAVYIEDRGLTAGDQGIFEGWLEAFEAQHASIRAKIQQQLDEKKDKSAEATEGEQ